MYTGSHRDSFLRCRGGRVSRSVARVRYAILHKYMRVPLSVIYRVKCDWQLLRYGRFYQLPSAVLALQSHFRKWLCTRLQSVLRRGAQEQAGGCGGASSAQEGEESSESCDRCSLPDMNGSDSNTLPVFDQLHREMPEGPSLRGGMWRTAGECKRGLIVCHVSCGCRRRGVWRHCR